MSLSITRRSRLAALAGGASLAAAVVAGGTAFAADGGVHAASAVITISSPATGGSSIASTTARIGGTGAWTHLTGPSFQEGSVGALKVGDRIDLGLPQNFEYNDARTAPPTVSSCDKAASAITYTSAGVASITIHHRSGAVQGSTCRIDFGTILQVRPVNASGAAGLGGNMVASLVEAGLPTPLIVPGNAGTIRMVVVAPTPTPTPGPAGPPVVIPATGGTGIQSNTALTGGSGAWTTLSGPTITEGSLGAWPIGERITLALPANFQWNQARTAPLTVSGCDRDATSITYSGNDLATVTLAARSGASQMGLCTISFGTTLQVRPLNGASSAGTGGTIALTFIDPTQPLPGVFPGGAGQVSMVTSTPPVGPLTLTITAPTMNNMAINWGEGINITTAGSPGTVYQVQVTTTDPSSGTAVWETLTDSSAVVRNFTIGSSGSSTVTPPYTPIRNYWYRSVSGTTVSNVVRVTVRQTIVIRPENTGTKSVSAGTKVTFKATVRPVRPELQKANVRFELYQKSGGGWVLSKNATITIDSDGVAAWTVQFNAGSWYVRAQAQPTPVNANSFWTPNQYYTAS